MVNFSYFSTLPLYIKARGGTEADVSLVVGSAGLMSLFARPLVGWLADSLGRRWMLIAGMVLAMLSSISYAFSVVVPLIVVSRMLGGIAFSLGLILVAVAGAELFTGNNFLVMAWASRRISS